MARMSKQFKAKCRENMNAIYPVVITLGTASVGKDLAEIGLSDAKPIPGISGLLKSRLSGHRLMELADRQDLEEIAEDIEIGMF